MNVSLYNDTQFHYILGDPIAHSLSPIIYNTLYRRYDLNFIALTAHVPKGELSSFLSARSLFRASAINLTIPHKSDIIPLLDEVDPMAKQLQSVNTVVLQGKALIGYSTDGEGYSFSLQNEGFSFSGQNVLILGAGGASSPIGINAGFQDASSITILARRIDSAAQLAQRIQAITGTICHADSMDQLNKYAPSTTLLIQTTPLGMKNFPHDFQSFDFLDALPNNAIVSDIVYNPLETNLLAQARKRKKVVVSGIGMLIWQAFAAFEKFHNFLPDENDFDAVCQALKQEGFSH